MTRTLLPALAMMCCFVALAGADGFDWRKYQKKPLDWFESTEARQIASNVLSHQSPRGDWPKNVDTGAEPYVGDPDDIEGTFDNSATLGETRFLAAMYRATGEEAYRRAVLKAVDHVLDAQYPNGGWPQHWPVEEDSYSRHITFNDGSMVNIMVFVRDLADSEQFAMLDAARKGRAKQAFNRGIDCIVACQIEVDGQLTVWCAQHDVQTLKPTMARSYELPSLSGAESAGIVRLLMTLKNPSARVARAIEAASAWFEAARFGGFRQEVVDGDKRLVADPKAEPLWARFYEIGTNRPIFSGRDGVIKYTMAEIESERRNGYSWYGDWGEEVAKEYARWKKR